MFNLVRGGAVLVLTSLFVVFIYAQTRTTEMPLAIANDSQKGIENNLKSEDSKVIDTDIVSNDTESISGDPEADLQTTQTNDKKLVKRTVSSKAVNAGASRGSFSATAYCFSGRTAMGHSVRRGLIAADPRVLKLGSKVVIEAGPWSGTYLVSDTGGAIKGKKIDIWVPSCGEARRFGRRSVQIYSVQ